MDDEQRKDLEFILASPNRAGRIRYCVRAMRLRLMSSNEPITIPDDVDTDEDMNDVTDEDILRGLTE